MAELTATNFRIYQRSLGTQLVWTIPLEQSILDDAVARLVVTRYRRGTELFVIPSAADVSQHGSYPVPVGTSLTVDASGANWIVTATLHSTQTAEAGTFAYQLFNMASYAGDLVATGSLEILPATKAAT